MPSYEPVRAILRGLDVLRTVSEHGPLPASDIAQRVGLPTATAIRMLETLTEAGYVRRQPNGLAYAVTARTKALSSGYDAASHLVQVAEPLVEELRARIGWPSNLAVFEGDAMVITYTNRAAYGLSIIGRLGARIPMLVSGVGMVYLAALPEAELEPLLARLRRSDDRWDSDPDLHRDLPRRLAEVRERGYGVAHQPYLDAIFQSRNWAVAVPITVGGLVRATVSSLIVRTGAREDELIASVLPDLRETARSIGAALASTS